MMLVPPKAPNNWQWSTPLTPNMKTGGMWFTFPQLAAGANVTFLNPSLDLSIAVERDSPSPWHCKMKTKKEKKKKLDGTKKVAEWKLLLLVQQHIKEGVLNQKWGGRQTYRMLSRQRRENSVHSTFSTNNEWKRGGGLCQWKKFGC